MARFRVPRGVLAYGEEHGSPIRYSYVKQRWPLSYYQTMFATEPGSAEMPSAGRAFTQAVVDRLEWNGIWVVPLVLHTGVASLESGEPPYPERYRVPAGTAEAVNLARESPRGSAPRTARFVWSPAAFMLGLRNRHPRKHTAESRH